MADKPAAEEPKKKEGQTKLNYEKGNFEFLNLTLLNQIYHKIANIDANLVTNIEVNEDILVELKKLNKEKKDG